MLTKGGTITGPYAAGGSDMAVKRTTKSGYTFQVVSPREILERASGDPWVHTCGVKSCGIPIQGGKAAVNDHYRVVHPDHR